MSAGALNDPGGDGEAFREVLVVFQYGSVFFKVIGTLVDGLAFVGAQLVNSSALAQSADHFGSLSLQDLECPLGHPVLGLNAPNGMEGIGSLPQVFQKGAALLERRKVMRTLTAFDRKIKGLDFSPPLWECTMGTHNSRRSLRESWLRGSDVMRSVQSCL